MNRLTFDYIHVDDSPSGLPRNMSSASGLVESASSPGLRQLADDSPERKGNGLVTLEPETDAVRFAMGDNMEAGNVTEGLQDECESQCVVDHMYCIPQLRVSLHNASALVACLQ